MISGLINNFKDMLSRSSPNIRDIEIAVVPMERFEIPEEMKARNLDPANAPANMVDVGVAVPFLYDLAENGGLKDQHIIKLLFNVWVENEYNQKFTNQAKPSQEVYSSWEIDVTEQFNQLLIHDPQSIKACFEACLANNPAEFKSLQNVSTTLLTAAKKVDLEQLIKRLFIIHEQDNELESKEKTNKKLSISPKTPFELMFVPYTLETKKNTLPPNKVENIIAREINYRNKAQLSLPFETSKITVVNERLKDMLNKGLFIKNGGESRHITINLGNTHGSTAENFIHFINSWLATTLTLFTVLSIGAYSPWLMVSLAVARFYINRSGNNFGFYELAENTLRDLRSLFSKEFNPIYRPSLLKTIDAAFKLSLIIGISSLAAVGMYQAAMNLMIPIPVVLVNGLPSMVRAMAPALRSASAYFLGAVSFYSTFINSLNPLRKERGLTINDNMIRVERDEVNCLPPAVKTTNSIKTLINKDSQPALEEQPSIEPHAECANDAVSSEELNNLHELVPSLRFTKERSQGDEHSSFAGDLAQAKSTNRTRARL